MCGIAGVIGKSKNPFVSHLLLTKLLAKSETRGNHASGFWGTLPGEDGAILYHKEPTPPTQFVESATWKGMSRLDPNLLILHARQTSTGMGDASYNKNNHPFSSTNRSIGLVHNGRLPEYSVLKKRYEVTSDCDSEILLRIYESTLWNTTQEEAKVAHPDMDFVLARRAAGFINIHSYINEGAMAVGIGERIADGSRHLWLFRNTYRTLWVVDARESIGQVFFCSTPEIWLEAMQECGPARQLIGHKRKIIEVPHDELWFFRVDDENPVVSDPNWMKWRIKKDKEWTPWNEDGERIGIVKDQTPCEIISILDNNDEPVWTRSTSTIIASPANTPSVTVNGEPYKPFTNLNQVAQKAQTNRLFDSWQRLDAKEDAESKFDVTLLNSTVAGIKRVADNVEVVCENAALEGSLSGTMFNEHLESLVGILNELEGLQKTVLSYSYRS